MIDLEEATTEDIVAELAKRPVDFAIIAVPRNELSFGVFRPEEFDGCFVAHAPQLTRFRAAELLRVAINVLVGGKWK